MPATSLDAQVSRLADELLFSTPARDCLDELEEQGSRAQALTRFAEAMAVQARVLQFRAHDALGQAEWAAASIALVEECAPQTAEGRLQWSLVLYDNLPVTWSLLREGLIPVASARTVADLAGILSPEECRALEEKLWPDGEDTIPGASGNLPNAVRVKCHKWIPVIHGADALDLQLAVAREQRDVFLNPAHPGTDMVMVSAPLTAPDGAAVMASLDAAADAAGPDDPRSRGMLRADALVEKITGQTSFALWADSASTTPLPVAQRWNVSVTVPLDVIVAATTDPGTLERSGIVTSATARLLATEAIRAGGRIARLVTDPLSGRLVDLTTQRKRPPETHPPPAPPPATLQALSATVSGPDPGIAFRVEADYAPSAALAAFVRARDKNCQHPGCRMPASRCDLDHLQPWEQGGLTAAFNLNCLCRRHHRLKHSPLWSLHKTSDGTLEWTAPSGRKVRVEPPDRG